MGIGQKLLEIEAGLYSEASVLSPEVINPDDQIALQDDRTFQLVLVPLPQFQSGIELGDVIGSDPTFSSSNITVVDNDSEFHVDNTQNYQNEPADFATEMM